MTALDIINIIVTIILIGLLVYGVFKKANASMLLLGLGIAGLLYATVVNGSVLGENTVGLAFFDVFEYTEDQFIAQLSSNIIILSTVMGYVTYMNSLKATDMMCLLLAKPLSVFKKAPMVIVGFIIIIVAVLKWVVFSNVGQVALVLATLYPIAISIGVSRQTMAAVLTFSSVIVWGPANGITLMYWGVGESSISVPEYFMHYELIMIPIALLFAIIAFGITSKYYDKKEKVTVGQDEVEQVADISSLGIPRWYAIFPMLPVILVIIFSSLVVGTITISVTSACILCMSIVFVLELLRRKDRVGVINETLEFWKGFGNIIWQAGCLVLTCAVFAGALSKIGGLNTLFSHLVSGDGSLAGLTLICAVCSALLTIVSGNMASSVTLFGAIMANASSAAGVPYETVVASIMPLCCTALCLSPVNPAALMLAGKCDVNIGTIIKRCLIPFIVFAVVILAVTLIFF